MSVRNYHYTLRNIPEQRRSQEIFFFIQKVQTGSGAYLAPYSAGNKLALFGVRRFKK
jgi:hypothetical protein